MYVIEGTSKSKICRSGKKAGNTGKNLLQFGIWILWDKRLETQAGFWGEFLLLQEISIFAFKTFKLLNEAHPHCVGKHPLR